MAAKVSIDFVANESDLIAAAKNAQKEMEALSAKLKAAGVSGAAFNKAVADAKAKQNEATKAAKELAAATDKLEKEQKEAAAAAADAAKKQRLSLTDIKAGIDLASQALENLKKGYDFAREGAALDFTTVKFERLSQSIGTTSQFLLNDLRAATKGTYSDMQLMASATDLVALGLTKDHDETVRLASVSAGLNMDMNQLVLTLTNMTTMRFDALGVQVDGFDEKVKQLEATGMSTNDAFKEAFLQQAEAQLLKVGNAADTALGTFMKFEAQTANLKDEMKMLSAEALSPLIPVATDFVSVLNDDILAMQKMEEQGINWFTATREQTEAIYAQIEAERTATDTTKELAAAVQVAKQSEEELAAAAKLVSQENQSFLGVLGQSGDALTTYREGLAAANQELEDGKIKAAEHAEKVQQLSEDYKQASADIVMSIVEMKLAQDGWTDAELNAYLQIGKQQGKFTQDQINMANGAVEMADRIVSGLDTLDGPMTHVGERAEDNADTFGQMTEAGGDLTDSLYDVSGGAAAATSAINSIPTTVNVDVYIRMHGRIPTNLGGSAGHEQNDNLNNAPLQGGYQQGGEVFAGVPVGVNEAGREVFMPQQNGRILGHAESLHALSLGGGGGSKYGPFYGPVTIQMSDESATGFMGLR
jgi:hypothetical protein